MQQPTPNSNYSDRYSYLWLLVGAGLSLFSGGRWTIPLAAWFSAIFWLRFMRTQKPLRGYVIAVVVGALVTYIALQGIMPVGPSEYLVTIAIGAPIAVLPLLADRLMAPRLGGFVSTLVYPTATTALEYLMSLTQPFGTWGSTAYTQADNLALIQIVSVTGIWGITFLLAWFASVVNWAWEREFDWKQIRVGAGIYAGIMTLVFLFGGARLALFAPSSDTVVVAGVDSPAFESLWKQEFEPVFLGGGDIAALKWDAILARTPNVNDDLLKLSARAARAGAKIVFWSEASAIVPQAEEAALIERGRALARQEQIYLGMTLWTMLHRDASLLPATKMVENKIVLIDPQGNVQWQYLKTIPVPGAEEAMTVKGDGKLPTLDTPYGRIAAAICFDMDFP
ncbi:MAG: nitrilase, partial [Chloroflexi bacterium]|nr:nitrilase [Chloroflexota bacterium]